jgi:phage tail sheath gpL-like
MPIDSSAVASVVGVDVVFQQSSGGAAQVLPQNIAVIAQGSSSATYPATKQRFTSAGAAGAIFGYRNPIYLALRELLPSNGDGVGTIPVTVIPLADAAGATAATGDITPSGTASAAAEYYFRIGGVRGNSFVIPAGAVDVNATLAKIGQSLSSVIYIPVETSYAYGSPTASAISGTGNGTLTALSVTGTPLPGAWKLTVNTVVANGGVWTLTDPLGSVVSAVVTMTPGVGGATVCNFGGLQFTLTDGTTDFGLGATFTITVPATKVNLTAGWKGTGGNAIKIELIGPSLGVVFAVTAMNGGLVDPTVDSALSQIGNVWVTMILNGLPIANTVALDTYKTFGDGRWGQTVKKPLIVFTGNIHSTPALASAVSSTRKTDKINSTLVAPGSPNLPIVVAARQLARIASVANNNPPTDYCAQAVESVIPGDDSVQWDDTQRNQALKAGCSTVEVRDGVINIGDVVTFYAPTGEDPPAYRDVVDIVRLQNIIYNMDSIFSRKEWAAAPLIPDFQPTTNRNARKPSMAKAAMASMVDKLGLAAILSDPAASKKLITAAISSINPKRLDVDVPVWLSGNSKVKSTTLRFSFFFGTPAVIG